MKLKSAWQPVAMPRGPWDLQLSDHLLKTGQDNLPQASVLKECLSVLTQKDLLEEAYLRGSFYRGLADKYSDIDFFAVVEPKNLEKTYDAVREQLSRSFTIITHCYDRLVPDYGGIGFMFLCRHEQTGCVLQMDLYMAMKGIAPKVTLDGIPRMYSKDPSYNWSNDPNCTSDRSVLPKEATDFINRFTKADKPEDQISLLFKELMITVAIADKHIKRGQASRTIPDNVGALEACMRMLQVIIGWDPPSYTPSYIGSQVTKICQEHGDPELVAAATRLDKMFTEPVSRGKMLDIYDLGETIFRQSCPNEHAKTADKIAMFRTFVLDKNTQNGVSSAPSLRPAAP